MLSLVNCKSNKNEEINFVEVYQEIKNIDEEMVDVDKKITEYYNELGIGSPFGGPK